MELYKLKARAIKRNQEIYVSEIMLGGLPSLTMMEKS